jgi:hypothetical protein
MRMPFVYELFPVRHPNSFVRKIGPPILGFDPMARLPECPEDFDEALFVRAICIQLDDASLNDDTLIVIVQCDNYPSVSVSFVGNLWVFLALECWVRPNINRRARHS